MSASILARLDRLEMTARCVPSVDVRVKQRACRALFDALAEHYPADTWEEVSRLQDGTITKRSMVDKVSAAADRLQAGTETESDRAALAAMPADALAAFDCSAEEFLSMVKQVLTGC